MRRLLLLGALLCVPAIAAREAQATVMVERSLDELARQADLIAVATPLPGRSSFWHQNRIYTDVTLSLSLVVQGSHTTAAPLRVRLPGGTVGEVGQWLAGAPELNPGVTYMLFLSAPRDGVRTVLNLSAGALPVTATPSGEVRVMPARAEGLTFVPAPRRSSVQRIELPAQGERLDLLVARLRAVVR